MVFIPGFKISVTGGTRLHGQLLCHNGDVLFLNFVPDNEDQEDSESEAMTSDHDTDVSESRDEPVGEECDDADVRSGRSMSAADTPPDGNTCSSGSQRGNDSTDCAASVDKWNLDFSVSGATQIGGRGDTSTSNAGQPPLAHCPEVPKNTGKRGFHDRTMRRSGVTSGIGLYLAGLVFMHNVMSGYSVLLPLRECDTCDSPSQEQSGFVQSWGSGSDKHVANHGFPRRCGADGDALSWQWRHQLDLETGDTWFLEDEQLSTLLDQAKGEDFHRLCGELARFFSAVESQHDGEHQACAVSTGDRRVCT